MLPRSRPASTSPPSTCGRRARPCTSWRRRRARASRAWRRTSRSATTSASTSRCSPASIRRRSRASSTSSSASRRGVAPVADAPIAVIPVAGVGTRLRPHTHTLPKVLLHVAGKPILAHILDDLPALGIHEAVLIVGYMGELIEDYVGEHYQNLKVHYVNQPERLGLGHAVSLAAPYVNDRPVLIILGDTIFEADLRGVLNGSRNSIGVKAVEDP